MLGLRARRGVTAGVAGTAGADAARLRQRRSAKACRNLSEMSA